MNIQIELYKNSLNLSDQDVSNMLKKARYILSKIETCKDDVIIFATQNLLQDKSNNEDIMFQLKKLMNMTVHLTQIDKLSNVVFMSDFLIDNPYFNSIITTLKFSGISNRYAIIPSTKLKYHKRYLFDNKLEYICRKEITENS